MFSKFKTLLTVFILLTVLIFETNILSFQAAAHKQTSLSTFTPKKCVAIASTPVNKSPIQSLSQRSVRTFAYILIHILYKDFTDLKVFKRTFDINHFKLFEISGFYQCRLYFHKF